MDDLRRSDGVLIAVDHLRGRGPTLVFLPGHKSDMAGAKALALEAWARSDGRAMLRFDYSGCGASGGRFEDGTIDLWTDDALFAIGAVEGPLILVGSSMGGWLMLLVAQALRERVFALVGVAAAPDFTDWGFTAEEKRHIARAGFLEQPSAYGEPMLTTAKFWRSGNANLLLTREIALDCPVRLLHGQRDADVPCEVALRLAAKLRSDDVQVTIVKDGDHRLSRERDIALLIRTLAALLETS